MMKLMVSSNLIKPQQLLGKGPRLELEVVQAELLDHLRNEKNHQENKDGFPSGESVFLEVLLLDQMAYIKNLDHVGKDHQQRPDLGYFKQ